MNKPITYHQFGEKAILIKWPSIIDSNVLKDILSFKDKIAQSDIVFDDIIQAYHSLTIIYKDNIGNLKNEISQLKVIYNTEVHIRKENYYLWEIPVCYDLRFGIDLEELSLKSNLSIKEIIHLHTQNHYTVFFIGFLPGFLYLSGLNEQIYFDRKPNPRLHVSKGAVAIGGKQTGIYPTNSAGGWNIIGNTPIHFFDVNEAIPCFTKPGDSIKFKSVSIEDYEQIRQLVKAGNYSVSKTLYCD